MAKKSRLLAKMIIDGKDLILGRVGTVAAKAALLGEKVDIVNCEQLVISGKKEMTLAKYKKKFSMGIHTKGPFYFKMPDRFVKRTIRGMLPHDKYRGEKALEKISCHIGVPATLKDQKAETVEKANISKLPSSKFITVKEICKEMGAAL